jgi:alkanesulfonate monooxygenase SsuD/methylene tetrahydromethanopterin reductase-like flavin-dependent oxidoreductase (luciferase family)
MVEAGNSPAGRDLAARQGDALMANVQTIEEMKTLREDMHRRLRAYGRDPGSFKVLFLVAPIMGATDQEAHQCAQSLVDMRSLPEYRETQLLYFQQLSGLDFGHYDMDKPCAEIMADLTENKGGIDRSSIDLLFKNAKEKTLGEMLTARGFEVNLGLIGSPETVAAKMDELMQEVGGDGFLFTTQANRRAMSEVADGLAPALRRRKLIRDGYEGKTLRDNLHAF